MHLDWGQRFRRRSRAAPQSSCTIPQARHPTLSVPQPPRMTQNTGITYRDAGVDIDAGDQLVERIKPLVRRTQRPEVLGGIGGFGALVQVPLDRYRKPVLVAGTDGV